MDHLPRSLEREPSMRNHRRASEKHAARHRHGPVQKTARATDCPRIRHPQAGLTAAGGIWMTSDGLWLVCRGRRMSQPTSSPVAAQSPPSATLRPRRKPRPRSTHSRSRPWLRSGPGARGRFRPLPRVNGAAPPKRSIPRECDAPCPRSGPHSGGTTIPTPCLCDTNSSRSTRAPKVPELGGRWDRRASFPATRWESAESPLRWRGPHWAALAAASSPPLRSGAVPT